MFKRFFNWISDIIYRIKTYFSVKKDAKILYHTYMMNKLKNPDYEYTNCYNPTPTKFPIGFQVS